MAAVASPPATSMLAKLVGSNEELFMPYDVDVCKQMCELGQVRAFTTYDARHLV